MDTSAAIRPEDFDGAGGSETGTETAALGMGGVPARDGSKRVRPFGGVRTVQAAEDGAVQVELDNGCARLQFLTGGVLRVRFYRKGGWAWETTAAIERYEPVPARIDRASGGVRLTADGWVAELTAAGRLRLSAADGLVLYELESVHRLTDGTLVAVHRASTQAHFYGLGEKTGFLDKRGERYTMWNTDVYAPHVPDIEALYVSVPFVIQAEEAKGEGLRACGVFLDNPGKTVFDCRAREDAYFTSAETGDLDLYIIPGPNLPAVVRRYTHLTGRLRLPPAWSLGYHQSRYSYMSEAEVREIARTFREKQIPCDVIHLDIHYMDGYRVFTFDPVRFPDPGRLVADLRADGFHVVPIVDPGVKRDPSYGTYVRGVREDRFCKRLEGDLFFGEVWPGVSAFPDFTDSEVRQWWGEEHRFYTDLGIDGIWNDMNEPAVFNETKTMDLDVMHRNEGNPRPHRELHNLYGMCMTQATYEGLRRLLGGRRPFVLTRSGYAGVGRYGAVWTGDNRSYWEHMEMAIPMVLNMGLSGIPFAGPDIGGFSHHATGELLARWTQMGALFPFCRNHSAINTRRQEPWRFTPEVEDACRKALQLRYRWLPYLYTLFEEASRTGLPVIRPLVLEYPDDPVVWNLSDEFLVGRDVLAAPVLRPGQRRRMVYLPRGLWRDLHSGTVYEGAAHVVVDAPLERMPVFVREGAILPEFPVRDHVCFRDLPYVAFTLYGRPQQPSSRCEWYEDDGETFAFESGAYNRTEVTAEPNAHMDPTGASGFRVTLRRLYSGYDTPCPAVLFRWRFASDADVTVPGREVERHDDEVRVWLSATEVAQGTSFEIRLS